MGFWVTGGWAQSNKGTLLNDWLCSMRFVVLYCQQRLHIRPLLFIGCLKELVRGRRECIRPAM